MPSPTCQRRLTSWFIWISCAVTSNTGTTAVQPASIDLADPAADGLPNLLEYALSTSTTTCSTPESTLQSNGPTLSNWSTEGVTEQVLSTAGSQQQVRARRKRPQRPPLHPSPRRPFAMSEGLTPRPVAQ